MNVKAEIFASWSDLAFRTC